MSTSAPAIDSRPAIAGPLRTPARGRVTQLRVFKSEWTKLYSLRSTRYALLATAVMTIGFGMIAAGFNASRWTTMSAVDKAKFDPLAIIRIRRIEPHCGGRLPFRCRTSNRYVGHGGISLQVVIHQVDDAPVLCRLLQQIHGHKLRRRD